CAPSAGLPIPFLGVPALGAHPGSVARIDRTDRDARECRLVGDEAPELRERPTLHAGSLAFLSRGPVADPREVFAADGARRALGLGDDPLRDDMVPVSPEVSFFHPGLTEFPLGALRARPLARPADTPILPTNLIDVGGEVLAIV